MARTKAEIDAMREGFMKGRAAECRDGFSACKCWEFAVKAFPYPKVTRYRRVTTSVGSVYESRENGLYFRDPLDYTFAKSRYHLSDIATLASLLDADTLRRIADSGKCGPTEEVEVE